MCEYPGRLMLRELWLSFKSIIPALSKWHLGIFSLAHATLPFLITLGRDFSSESNTIHSKYKDPFFWVYSSLLWTINFGIFYVNLTFIEIGVIDMKRRKFAMMAIETLLEPNRFKVKAAFQMYPLLNYFDPQTLLSWLDSRMIMLDLG